ncbi:hypothetical protein PENTCL1PPCAC_21182 [Pristionchus entomophagus]|uniref:Uncharacterized protein n=1 Tax=Pristionchus entomophagus TaxID=358040 RepID=A0AAV5TXT4_9BILA|nr:hypothetical protein PENTCL1PPCAC_21182 [Pristionchus entomophagus]
MSLTRVIVCFLAVFALTEAFVEFEKSRLYDEKDFEGQATITMSNYCGQGCRIFVSVPDSSSDIARNILIDDNTSQKSLFDANTKGEDGQKIPYTVQNAGVHFVNHNDGLISAPILVWVVRTDALNIDNDSVEVYDADDTIRNGLPAGIITILDAEPFVVNIITAGPGFPFEAITAGFDAIGNDDKCTRVIQEDAASYQDLHGAEVRSPLITFVFNSGETEVQLQAQKTEELSYDLTRTLFVTSPGYIGCDVKEGQPLDGGSHTKTYRSSTYAAANIVYNILSDDPVSITISADLNTDQDHAVEIIVDNEAPVKWAGINSSPSDNFLAKDLIISWTRNDADLDQYFLIRVQADIEPIKTTTAEPEPEPVKTTTVEPEPEPLKTTTTGPEPEPVKTTTSDPDPEPEKTTTVETEPEPVKTTTAETEPEPERTTTEEPEHTENTKLTTALPPSRRTQPTTTFHPRPTAYVSTAETSTSTTPPTTTSGAAYGSILLSIALAAMVFI